MGKVSRAHQSSFWGNGRTALRPCKSQLVLPRLLIRQNLVVDPVATSSSILNYEASADRPIGFASRVHLAPVAEPPLCKEMVTAPVPCIERWSHRKMKGFAGPHACRICATLRLQSDNFRILHTYTKSGKGSCAHAMRSSRRVKEGGSLLDGHFEVTSSKGNVELKAVRPTYAELFPKCRPRFADYDDALNPLSHSLRRDGGHPKFVDIDCLSAGVSSSLSVDTLGRTHGTYRANIPENQREECAPFNLLFPPPF